MMDFGKRRRVPIATLVLGAALVSGGKAAADFVINDDLIVLGSTCVGFDCVDGESFGSDTIRLKENQLRIHFMDTSVSPFPSNDWRLLANDTGSGGSNFFAIEDSTAGRQIFKVEAGAAANALFVDSTSRVGLRTSTPVLDLHINTGDTPAHRLEQNAGGGFTAQTWDIGANEANFFVRDVTGGSRLPLRIPPGAPTSSIDITKDGNVGIGTVAAATKLQVGDGTAAVFSRVSGTVADLYVGQNTATAFGIAAGGLAFVIQDAAKAFPLGVGTTGNQPVILGTGNAERVRIDASGNVGVGTTAPTVRLDVSGNVRAGTLNNNPPGNTMCFGTGSNILGNCTSDLRLKRDLHYLDGNAGLAAVMQLRPANFRWHDGDDRVMAGFVAQDTERAIPAAVHQPAGSEFLALDTGAVLAYAVKAIQELKADNDDLRAEIARLKAAR
jgi:hypothetical protein